MSGVSYQTANNGSVQYVADGDDYLGRFPLRKDVTASTKGVNGNILDIEIATLKGDNTRGEYFSQGGNSSWAKNKYDHCQDTAISCLGCALTDMAMILNTFGFPCDPGTLNDWMKDPTNGGFKGKDV